MVLEELYGSSNSKPNFPIYTYGAIEYLVLNGADAQSLDQYDLKPIKVVKRVSPHSMLQYEMNDLDYLLEDERKDLGGSCIVNVQYISDSQGRDKDFVALGNVLVPKNDSPYRK